MWTRNRLTVLAFAITILLLGTTVVSPTVKTPPGPDAGDDDRPLVSLGDSETVVWPYVSSRTAFGARASALNIFVQGDAERVQARLKADDDGWNETTVAFTEGDRPETDFVNDSLVVWSDAVGADRYVYYRSDGGDNWTDQSYQLHHGDYFGGQYHIRAYEIQTGSENWTAVQAHAEHWDWFTLTHTVDSLEEARIDIEQKFIQAYGTDDVRRVYHDNGDSHDHDGWTTVVYLLVLPLLGATTTASATSAARALVDELWTRRTRLRTASFFGPAAVLLGVRLAGITAENALPVSPDTTVAVLYPVLVLGTPAVAYLSARGLDPIDGFLFGTLGFGSGVVVDYGFIGISVLPIEIILHRIGLAVAVGLVAAGATRFEEFELRQSLFVGAVLWGGLVVLAHYV